MNTTNRISITDSRPKMIAQLAGHCIESKIVLCQLLFWDPNNCEENFMFFDDHKIYDSRIFEFFHNCCSQKFENFEKLKNKIREERLFQQMLYGELLENPKNSF